MDGAVEKYRKRREKRLNGRKTVDSRYDGVDMYRERRKKRLEARMDAGVGWVFGALNANGVDTKGMDIKEAFEAWNKLNGGETRKSKKEETAGGEKKMKIQARAGAYKTGSGLSFPKIKKGEKWDVDLLDGIEKGAKKDGKEKAYNDVVRKLTDKDVEVIKNAKGVGIAAVPGLVQRIDTKLVGLSDECQKIYDAEIERGKKITQDMIDIARENGYGLKGLEHCYKGGKSASEKVGRKREKDKKIADGLYDMGYIDEDEHERMTSKSDEDYVRSFDDVVRYTAMGNHDDTVKAVKDTIDSYKKRGYECIQLDNKWLPEYDKDGKEIPKEYVGVHASFRSPDGDCFEVQIHSDESMAVKEKNHSLYEEQRTPGTSLEKRRQLGDIMVENVKTLKPPKGIYELKSFDHRKK